VKRKVDLATLERVHGGEVNLSAAAILLLLDSPDASSCFLRFESYRLVATPLAHECSLTASWFSRRLADGLASADAEQRVAVRDVGRSLHAQGGLGRHYCVSGASSFGLTFAFARLSPFLTGRFVPSLRNPWLRRLRPLWKSSRVVACSERPAQVPPHRPVLPFAFASGG
jgi:hypothetical protein